MKIAIKGHLIRGKEVIQILESLGGINRMNHKGHYTNYFYYVSGDDNTIAWTCVRPQHLSVFTLEEFEKEFPFKIGDRVISATTNFIGTITKLKEYGYYYVKHDSGNLICVSRQYLKLYKEMKEERNITLTLDKAKEWYKKGGELREIALQAFTEKELNPLPRSWEEFCTNYPIQNGEAIIDEQTSQIRKYNGIVARALISDKNVCTSQKSAEAHLAMIQLEQLRDCWRQGWKPDWTNDQQIKYCVICFHEEFKISKLYETRHFLSFPTREIAEEFLKCFRDLIEKAGDLI